MGSLTASPSICWHPDAEPRDKGITPSDAAVIAAVSQTFREPINACETGAFPGTVTHQLLKHLPDGSRLTSWERDERFAQSLRETSHVPPPWAAERTSPLPAWVVGMGTPPTFEYYVLTLVDSSPYDLRNEEIELWAETAPHGATLVVHDVFDARWRQTPVLDDLRGVALGGPWGVGIYQKG